MFLTMMANVLVVTVVAAGMFNFAVEQHLAAVQAFSTCHQNHWNHHEESQTSGHSHVVHTGQVPESTNVLE